MSKESLQMDIVPPTEDCPYWIVNFPDLFVGAQGVSLGEAVQNGFVALRLWVEDCESRGVLDEALRESGLDEFCSDTLKNGITENIIPYLQNEGGKRCHS